MAVLPSSLIILLVSTLVTSIDVDYDDTSAFDRLDAVIRTGSRTPEAFTTVDPPTYGASTLYPEYIPIISRYPYIPQRSNNMVPSQHSNSQNYYNPSFHSPPPSKPPVAVKTDAPRFLEYIPKISRYPYSPQRSNKMVSSQQSNRRNYNPSFQPPPPPPPPPKPPIAVKTEAPGFLDYWLSKLFPTSQSRDDYKEYEYAYEEYDILADDYKQKDVSASEKSGNDGVFLPTVHSDPLVNKLFYWTVAGIALPAIFGVPYGKVTITSTGTSRRRKRGAHLRSASDGYDFNGLNIIQWISMLQDVYEKFDYNDLECQKRLICEVLREPDYFGSTARKMKHGFQLARYLEVLNMPDDFRELLDEYIDASDRANGQKDCNEFYQCPYSLKDSIKRNFSGNSL